MRRTLALALVLLPTASCADAALGGASPQRAQGVAEPRTPTSAAVLEAEPEPEPFAEWLMTTQEGQSPSAGRVIDVLLELRDSVKHTLYQGRTDIREEEGYYAWDCSGMSNWILKRAAPKARKALAKGRPVARDFYKVIDAAPLDRSRRGWQRLSHVSEARPGDVFAWLRSPASKSKISGHVGFLVSTPVQHPLHSNAYTARIVDSTSLPHGNDTRSREGEGGFGFGTLMFLTDETGETVAYGWHGERSLEWGFMPAKVLYGRVGN